MSGTWSWDGATWTPLASTVGVRAMANMVFDSSRGKVILFGGYNVSSNTAETWEYSATRCSSPSCFQEQEVQPGEREPDPATGPRAPYRNVVMHIGDHVYADNAHTRAEYREKYERAWKREGMRNLHKSTALWEPRCDGAGAAG